MGNADSIPVVSQLKSAVQAGCGDMNGALQTQENFTRQCPIISHMRNAIEDAVPPQERRPDTVCNALADVIPGVGHIKGAVHYAMGDHPQGERAMKAASRSTAVIGGTIVGLAVGGLGGAVTGGDAGNRYMDAAIATAEDAIKGKITPGEAFDGCAAPLLDTVEKHHKAGAMWDKVEKSTESSDKSQLVQAKGESAGMGE
ncbi:uncharacterized protein LOC129583416 [Paramacrobiotus metropolitanus]|uniref:uncharacterized protein LOC129583416 n=1 Tax=Paramacrobiotus metropolitanus TaxID=2943436 RepID=UPI002445D298|nr:uncharacterized protein LOC129583416 [Paramacrobiotus metropolitanus]